MMPTQSVKGNAEVAQRMTSQTIQGTNEEIGEDLPRSNSLDSNLIKEHSKLFQLKKETHKDGDHTFSDFEGLESLVPDKAHRFQNGRTF
ncbi:hypothetical protein ACH5RR_032534 [Cinchona calisaya]|uniref:Uncharacterized protein n=1 Tax=Cinchona calisaya TaxID=153742 RepID=A0ABD2YMS7_9GENT